MKKSKTVQILLVFSVVALILSMVGVVSIWYGQKNHQTNN
ncbi:lipase, partial [Listeria monocytogenes]|nr:lipase [Listeria monocytogenes]